MVAPPWEGDRIVSSSTTAGREMQPLHSKAPQPPAPRNRSSSTTTSPFPSPINSSDTDFPARSASATGLPKKRAPPPKPSKPSALTTSSSQIAVPQLSPLPAPALSRVTETSRAEFSPITMHDMESSDGASAPPLPRRKETASSTGSFVSASDSLGGRTFPPPPPTKGVRQLEPLQRQRKGGSSILARTDEGERAPPLPPRRDTASSVASSSLERNGHDARGTGRANGAGGGLMDDDDTGRGGLDRYKPLLPG